LKKKWLLRAEGKGKDKESKKEEVDGEVSEVR
jgi:hypothetical protein